MSPLPRRGQTTCGKLRFPYGLGFFRVSPRGRTAGKDVATPPISPKIRESVRGHLLMTLVAAWVRHHAGQKELYVASDSRLNGGRTWDIGTKIFDLGRGDAVIAFAGMTADAYPLMLQLQAAIKMHQKTLSRAYDLAELKGHMLRIFNAMWKSISDLPVGQTRPDPAEAKFILAGYSWRYDAFKIWTLVFHAPTNEFLLREASLHRKNAGGNKYFAFIGDGASQATNRVYEKLRERNRVRAVGLHMEPFEVLVEFIRDTTKPSIGGPPNVHKIYKHLNTLPYNVYWPTRKQGTIAFGGRMLLPYERNGYLAIDPDSLDVAEPAWPKVAPIDQVIVDSSGDD